MSTRSTISKKAAITDPDQGGETRRKRMTVPEFMARKGGEPLVCLTSYTAHVAHICDAVCDLLLREPFELGECERLAVDRLRRPG